MTRDEMRRLAIRLAKHYDHVDSVFHCGVCKEVAGVESLMHTPDCPIAELEAEEAEHEQP